MSFNHLRRVRVSALVLCAALAWGGAAAARAASAGTPAPAADGATYFVIPISGEIGVETTAEMFKKALLGAKAKKATHVLLAVDSPGGLITEEREICEAIQGATGIEFVAVVKQAYSAAAIISMACPTIVMYQEGSIGATPPMLVGVNGIKLVEEKFRSAIEAGDRAIAEKAGHDPLLVRGMHELEIELSLVPPAGKTGVAAAAVPWKLAEAKAGAALPAGAKQLKRPGSIMTLTAAEAYSAGLSTATVTSIEDVRTVLGIGSWKQVGDMTLVMKRQGEKNRAAADKSEHAAKVQPEVDALDRQMKVIALKVQEGQNRINEYQAAARRSGDDLAYRTRLLNKAAEFQTAVDILVADYRKLEAKKKELMAGPKKKG